MTTAQPLTARDRAAALRGKATQTAQEDLDALLEVVKAIHSTLDVPQLLDLVVAKAIALTGADRGCLIVTHDLGQCVEVARDRDGALPPESFRPSRTIVERVVERQSALVLADVAGSEFGGQQSVVDLGIRMALCAPMLAGDDLFGLLYVDGAAGQVGFSESRLRTLDALAGQAVIAWQQARMFAEIRGLYEKLRILDAAKMDFIDVASHELRTPLSIIRGYTEMLGAMMDKDNQGLRTILDSILGGVMRLGEIVNMMLSASQIDQGEFPVRPVEYSVRAILRDVAAAWQSAVDDRGQHLEVLYDAPDGDSLTWRVDAPNFKVVLDHLVQNAIKFTPDGGTISLRVSRLPGALQIEVIDTGIGVEAQHLELIFEKFYRVGETRYHSTGKTKFKGAGPGLGLFVARGIVTALGGHLWAESAGPDRGSRFVVVLPEIAAGEGDNGQA